MAKILVQYEADTAQLTSKLQGVEKANTSVQSSATKTGDTITKAFTAAGKSTEGAANKAGAFKNVLDQAKTTAEGYSNIFGQIAAGIGAAFATEKVIAFAKESVKAFQEAELNAKKLQVAVGVNGGLTEDFNKLIEQSDTLQKITIFSDDDIQRAQTIALQYGLTADQVEKLIPIITDYASATGDTLDTALNNVIGGLEGNARALKKQGIQLKENADTAEQLANITDQLTTKFKGQAEVVGETSAGAAQKLANQFDDLKEKIGSFISGFTDAGATLLSFVLNGLTPLNDGLDSTESNLKLTTEELKKFGDALVKSQISALEGQIASLAAKGADVSKLNAELDKLKNKQIAVEITGLSNEEINQKITTLEAIRFKTSDITKQLNALKEESKKRNLDLIASEKSLTSLSEAELEKRKTALIEASKQTNSATLRDAIEAINKELDARKKAKEKTVDEYQKGLDSLLSIQKEYEQKSKEQLAANEFEKIEILRQAAIDKAKEALKQAGGTLDKTGKAVGSTKAVELFNDAIAKINLSFDKTEKDARVKATEEANKEIAAINKKNQDEILKATLESIDNGAEKEKQIRIEKFIQSNDFTKDAQTKLEADLLQIETAALNKKLELQKAAGNETSALEKGITDNLKSESDKRVELAENEKQERIRIFSEIVDATLQLGDQLFNFLATFNDASIQKAEEQKSAQLEKYDAELQALEDLNSKKAISDRVYEQKKAALLEQRAKAEKKADAELKKLKTEQAEADKLKAIFDTIINTSTAVVKFLAQGSIPLSIAAGITGALELATIIAQPIPKFFKGTKFVELNGNKKGIDTVPAMLHEGERVVTASNNKKHWEIYEAIENNQFKKFVEKNYLMPQLRAFKAGQEKEKQKDFAGQLAASFIGGMSGLSYYDADRLRKKGITINNAEEIAGLLASKISDGKPTYYGAW